MFDKNKFIENSLRESAAVKLDIFDKCRDDILRAADIIIKAFRVGNKLMLCGNGGSAADCQHIATEFVVRLSHDMERPAMPAIALTTDSSNLTAGGNDIGFENVFARSVEGLGKEGDVLIGISTSGNSSNIIKAIESAKKKKVITIGLLGCGGGKISSHTDHNIIIPSSNVQRIQEGHITVGHILCEIAEREMFDKK
ncbi:MAG: D-sedoheptulose 7-phosphate isomerase [Ignavibacteria bacterium]